MQKREEQNQNELKLNEVDLETSRRDGTRDDIRSRRSARVSVADLQTAELNSVQEKNMGVLAGGSSAFQAPQHLSHPGSLWQRDRPSGNGSRRGRRGRPAGVARM